VQKAETAIEIKVGALVLFAVALLVAFVVVLGDFSWQHGHVVFVDYDNAAGLKPGADVAISGIKAGRVERIDFLGGEHDEEVDRRVFVRVKIVLEPDRAAAVREDSQFYITTQGVLGEKYIEVLTKTLDAPPLAENTKVRGVDPPRMELLLARASKLLNDMTELLGRDDIPIGDLIRNTNSLVKHGDEILVENRGKFGNILSNVEVVTDNAKGISAALESGLDDGSDIRATLRNTRGLTGQLNRRIGPLANKAEMTLESTQSLTENLDGIVTGKRAQIEGTLDNVYAASADLAATSADVRVMVSDVEAGRGSLGALLKDEEIYDDLKETLRELKRRPWKIIWKE
jgi:phospholipid/cholesterol/gamma-HCH transport system substrate-binding protein